MCNFFPSLEIYRISDDDDDDVLGGRRSWRRRPSGSKFNGTLYGIPRLPPASWTKSTVFFYLQQLVVWIERAMVPWILGSCPKCCFPPIYWSVDGAAYKFKCNEGWCLCWFRYLINGMQVSIAVLSHRQKKNAVLRKCARLIQQHLPISIVLQYHHRHPLRLGFFHAFISPFDLFWVNSGIVC